MSASDPTPPAVMAPPIDEVVRAIVERFAPERIILFGSWARGDAGPDSDVDLLVEMESELSPPERAIALRRALVPRTWALDLLVWTPAEAARMRRVFGSLAETIDREGRVLYERA